MHRKRILMFFRNTVSVVLALSMMFGNTVTGVSTVFASETATVQKTEQVVTEEKVNSGDYGLADDIQDGTILHCFDWTYNQIIEELPNIAAAGFTSVQTSPAQKGCGDSIWYELYQPLGFWISDNALGSKADLQKLCTEADKYGINVIVDVVANHLAGDHTNIDDGLKDSKYWHNSGYTSDGKNGTQIDWTNRWQVTHGDIGMPDLNSEDTTVQSKVKSYIEELKGVGVDGIRWDAAKHISLPSEECTFWSTVTSTGLYNYGEILEGPANPDGNGNYSDAIKGWMKEYTNYMSVTDNGYGSRLMGNFRDGKVPADDGFWSGMGVSPSKMVYWAESHDTYANNENEGGWTKDINENAVDRAYAIAASRADATALYFSRPFEKAKTSIKQGVKGSTHFTSKQVAAVNHLHNATIGQKDKYVYDSNANVAAVCRETGATIVKGSGSGQVSITNGGGLTQPGTYTDEISGNTFTVTSSTISGTIGDTGIAVIYAEDKLSVSASLADGSSFKGETTDVTVTANNAKSASYSINGGAEVAFAGSKKITIGEGVAYDGTVKLVLKATSESGETVTKTYTYTKKEAGKVEKNTVYFTKPSGWGTPNIYAYVEGETATNLTGKWPGTALTKGDDDVYTYTFDDSVSKAKVIFTDGTNQDPTNVEGTSCGFDYVAGKAYTYENGTWTAVEVPTNTPIPTVTNTVTPSPTVTEEPTPTVVDSSISVDFADGSEFATETKTIKITAANNAKGTYSVDNGPVKEFTGTAQVVIGKGKIADRDVTVKVTVGEETKAFTYKKVFNADIKDQQKNQAASEETVEEAKVNTAAETGGMYATNPGGAVGKRATITIDGSFSDWSEDMLIAQGGAWDIANNWKGGHENCVLDDYALYAAWDSDNLYIGWQMVNTTDTWANPGDGPLSDGGRVLDVPLMLAINVGNRPAMTGMMANGKLIWDALDVQFETRVDNILLMSGKAGLGTPGYFIASDESGGASYDPEYCLSFKNEGISYKMAEGCLPSTIMGLVGSTSPEDAYDASKYQAVTGHDNKYDSFYEINIPLKTLGIDESYITEHGIGVMQVATRGTSAIDCIPHDPSMLDNALGDCAVDPSTSHEKDDTDIITVPLASVGKLQQGGNITVAPTRAATPTPTTAAATATPAPTTAPTVAPGELAVNFGADRSAPQYNTTELAVKAEVTGANGACTYEFFVDDKSVQKSEKDTYTWKGDAAGAHTIKVVVTDSKGATATVAKEYDLEADATATVTPDPTVTPVITDGPDVTITQGPTPTPDVDAPLTITKFDVKCNTTDGKYKVGDKFTLEAATANAQGEAKYMFTYVLNDKEVIVKNYGTKNTASFVAEEAGEYTFRVYVVDNRNDTSPEFTTGGVKVVEKPEVSETPTVSPGITEGPVPTVTDTPVITGEDVVTVTPTVTVTATPTATVTDAATPTPTTPVVEPSKKLTPTVTPTEKPDQTPTVTPTKKPTATPTPKAPKEGTIVVDEATQADYKVISAKGSNKTVQYTAYQGTKQAVAVPSTITINKQKYKVTSIADSAFKNNKKIKSVYVGKNITTIGKSAFYGCTSLQKVTGCTNVKTIKDKAFYGCKKLTSVSMKSKLTSIGKYSFYKCTALKKITIPAKVSKIGAKAFYGCKNLKKITIKTTKLTNRRVGNKAFKNINTRATVKVPGKKVNSYKKLLKKKGLSSKATVKR